MQKNIYHYTLFAQTNGSYGAEDYGESNYSQTGQQTQVPSNPSGSQDGLLANTGADIVLPVALGAAMIIGSVVAIIKMRKTKKTDSTPPTQ